MASGGSASLALRSRRQQSSCIATRRYRIFENSGENAKDFSSSRSDRGFSRKVQRMVREMDGQAAGTGGGKEEGGGERRERYEQRNWKKRSERELSRMAPVARSRYLAVYRSPPLEGICVILSLSL